MKVIMQTAPGGVDTLYVGNAEAPRARADEVLIQVRAAGVNRPDVFQREGAYPPPADASPYLGLEVAGVVASCGASVTQFAVGDRVCALVNGGGYAEYVTAPAAQCLTIPNGYSFIEAAALPETFFTVWHNLVERGAMAAGQRVLVHGGGSGIGTTAIQLARWMGAAVFTTVGSADKALVCEALGAQAINYQDADFVEVIKSKTEGRGVDVILDMVGGDYVAKNIQVAARDGRIVNIASLRGGRAQIDMNKIMSKRLVLTGSTLRPQSAAVKAGIARALQQQVWPNLTAPSLPPSGLSLAPIIDSVFPLAQIADAHLRMESNRHIGKIVLDLTQSEQG